MVKETNSPNIKKNRKNIGAENDAQLDIYKKVVEFEEKESTERHSSMDANIYFELCQDIKEMLREIFVLKNQSIGDPCKTKEIFKELQTEIFVKLCVIKKLNRIDKIKHVFGKETLSVEKQKCDSIKLSYQNLVYELHHLVAETTKCLAFKSKDKDIELVPLEEFMKDAPESLSKKFEEYNSQDTEQRHSLRLARLEFELTQRKNLAQLCKSLEGEQAKLGQDLIERKEKLNMLRPLLLNIIKATKPLQEHLDISMTQLRVEHKLASLLPDPLYIFYVNIISFKSVYDLNINVEIIGDEDEATQWKEAPDADSGLQNDEDSDQETDIPEVEEIEVVKVKKRRHRKSVQQVDPMEEKKKKFLEVYPLSVEITVKVANDFSIILKFQYHTKLKIVTVVSKVNIPANITENCAQEILSSENILGGLMENDFGTESPNPITQYQLKKIGINSYQSLIAQIGYAYHWAQRLCGMDFLSRQLNNDNIASVNIENVMKKLFKCLKARYDLSLQLQNLEQNMIPRIPSTLNCPTNFVSSLKSWSATTYQQFSQKEYNQVLIEEELVNQLDFFYSINITRGNARLQAFIIIKNNYPDSTPIFSLCLNYNGSHHSGNCDDIRDMERLLNLSWQHDETSSSWLLSVQIAHLLAYLDVYLETAESKNFPQTTTFIRSICGRNRKRPFKFRKMGSGIFTQY